MNYERINKVITCLLSIELDHFGEGIGLLGQSTRKLTREAIIELVYAIDELAWSNHKEDQQKCTEIIALAWSYLGNRNRELLRPFLITSLSRSGTAPTSWMLSSQDKDRKFAPTGSFETELAVTALQAQYSEIICGAEYQLTRFQFEILKSIEENEVLGISAPTSAGKSHALYLAIRRHTARSRLPVIFVVPTISLVNQVSEDIRDYVKTATASRWQVKTSAQTFVPEVIYVLTQERAMVALPSADKSQTIGLLIADEIQNLERTGTDTDLRSKILFDLLFDLNSRSTVAKIVLSGPYLSGLSGIGKTLFLRTTTELSTQHSPVASITYAVVLQNKNYVLKQYSLLLASPLTRPILYPEKITGYGKSRYDENYYSYLNGVLRQLSPNYKKLIFSPTVSEARKTALAIAKTRRPNLDEIDRSSLADYLVDAVHPMYDLVELVKKGIAFHSGAVPPHVRFVVEHAYRRGVLDELTCTTTLMQGVNLPSNLIILRNPNLSVRANNNHNPQLTNYELANLRGRAGRLLKDLVGRTLILDGSWVSERSAQGDLFSNTSKPLKAGYGDLFSDNRSLIEEQLFEPYTHTSPEPPHFITTYIRGLLLRLSEREVYLKLNDLEIPITADELSFAKKALDQLDIGTDVVASNRYWDPFDLQTLKDNIESAELDQLPDSPWNYGAQDNLRAWLEFMKDVVPHYFERHLGKRVRVPALAKSATKWAQEVPLKKIIEEKHFSSNQSSGIEEELRTIYNRVSYGIPALLKPVLDLAGAGSGFVAAIENGAFHNVTRFLMARGLYRETAVHLKRNLLPAVRNDEQAISEISYRAISEHLEELNPWLVIQLENALEDWS